MIWVAALEISAAVMIIIAIIIAIRRDWKSKEDESPEKKKLCDNCRWSEEMYPTKECVYVWCIDNQEVVTRYTVCDSWKEKKGV